MHIVQARVLYTIQQTSTTCLAINLICLFGLNIEIEFSAAIQCHRARHQALVPPEQPTYTVVLKFVQGCHMRPYTFKFADYVAQVPNISN